MMQLFRLIHGLVGEMHAELFEQVFVHLRKDDGRMCLTAAQFSELRYRALGGRVACGTDAQRDEHLIGMQARVVVAEAVYLQPLYRLDYRRGYELERIVDARKGFERVHEHCRGCAEQI